MIDTSALRELFDDEKMIRKYIRIFRDDAKATVENLKHSVQRFDWENASIHAHSLKSQLNYLNESKLADKAFHLEWIFSKLSPESRENFDPLILDFDTSLSELLTRIDRYIKQDSLYIDPAHSPTGL
jgi:HPt (histidine-containing phosphotransfer) domain-containing protein